MWRRATTFLLGSPSLKLQRYLKMSMARRLDGYVDNTDEDDKGSDCEGDSDSTYVNVDADEDVDDNDEYDFD